MKRYLGMPETTIMDWLNRCLESDLVNMPIDSYNQGEVVQDLEQKTAKILGKESALFFPKGMTAQYAMLKANEEGYSSKNFICHPLSHIAWDEQDAYKKLLNLNGILTGNNHQPFSTDELHDITQSVASLVVELPLRRAGFRLTEWQELENIQTWCQQHNTHFHMDGARLWESCSYYHKTEAEIAALFDSVYVSFYKGLGGIGGAVLAGDKSFIESCRIWRSRLAGDQFTSFPQVITALNGLACEREKLPGLVKRAKEIANELELIPHLTVQTPQTNGFFVFIDGDIEVLNQQARQLNAKTGIKLFRKVDYYPNTEQPMIEIQVGHSHQEISNNEITNYFMQLGCDKAIS